MNFFKPEDFNILGWNCSAPGFKESVALVANAKLEKEGVRVTGWFDEEDNEVCFGSKRYPGTDTHQALLVCIEKLPKKECVHEPNLVITPAGGFVKPVCKHCGVELEATWRAKE